MQVAVGYGKIQGAGRDENGDSDVGDMRRVAVMDPGRRLETIEENQTNSNSRAGRLHGRGRYANELEAELEGFVGRKKPNMTGSR